ncbi:MAG: hypothetical protein ABI462_06970, partial [Ignavibacteria bacterium]
LKINDGIPGDTGTLYGWGIQFGYKPKTLLLKSLIQGFYNSSTNLMVPDTIKVILRDVYPPYAKFDSTRIKTDSTGTARINFDGYSLKSGKPFYIQLRHRNSIETWNKVNYTTSNFISGNLNFQPLMNYDEYDFTANSSSAFGNNLAQIDTAPLKFGLYSGDINQDGTINLTDIISCYNGAINFITGYKVTDVNGDNNTNLSDILIVYNNSVKFVTRIIP